MSTQNIINSNNLPTDVALGQYLREESLNLLKHLRFEIGCSNPSKLREILILDRLVCSDSCYITDEQEREIREEVIRKAISKIYEL